MKTFNTEGAAEFLNISEDKLLDLVRDGEIDCAKIGKGYVFTDEDLGEFIRAEVRKQTAARRGQKLAPEPTVTRRIPPPRRRPAPPPPLPNWKPDNK